jgi:hypothetical protein
VQAACIIRLTGSAIPAGFCPVIPKTDILLCNKSYKIPTWRKNDFPKKLREV